MGLATIPIFDCGEIFSADVEWDWLTKAVERFDSLCLQLGVASLGHFTNASRHEAILMMSEEEVSEMEEEMGAELRNDGYYLPNGELLWYSEDRWFNPADGIKTVSALLEYTGQNAEFWDTHEVEKDVPENMVYILDALGRVLIKAQRQGCLFHLRLLC